MNASNTLPTSPSLFMRGGLWVAQVLMALVYILAGVMKLTMSIAELLAAQIPWVADVPIAFVRFTGLVDLAAGLGILLPALTRISPKLTVWAAIGSIALQVCAAGFHISRGEYQVVPMNIVLIALALFVAWGRTKKAPILPRKLAVAAR